MVLAAICSLAVRLAGGALMAGMVALAWPMSRSTLVTMAVAVGLMSWLSQLVGKVREARRNRS
jgi:hypothetical protein